ncbi:MAG TPA: hypothetical protein VFR10_06685 [bacterium]|nr:hypothetical protein [bacterium]
MKEFFTATVALMALSTDPVMKEAEVDNEREIALSDVPEAARVVILEEAGEHPVLEVDEIIVEGDKLYEAEWNTEGHEVEITVTADGTIVGREIEDTADRDEAEEGELD